MVVHNIKILELERYGNDIFSKETHSDLEDFIVDFIMSNKPNLPTVGSIRLIRELFLYGFLKATGHVFDHGMSILKPVSGARNAMSFNTNNGVLAVADNLRNIYIRGGDSYHGYFDADPLPQGVEGTLLELGYRPNDLHVPHSNGDLFYDYRREYLFESLHEFSTKVRALRGEASKVIISDPTKEMPKAPYIRRNKYLPTIVLTDVLFIPGNDDKTISIVMPDPGE